MDYHDMAESLRRQQQFVAVDEGRPGIDMTCRMTAHFEGDVLVVDSLEFTEPVQPPPNNDRSPFGCYLRRRGRK